VSATNLLADEPEGASLTAVAGAAYSLRADSLSTEEPANTEMNAVAGEAYTVDAILDTEIPTASVTEGE
jgi:hypothetical protein